jgi:hypothetical protein
MDVAFALFLVLILALVAVAIWRIEQGRDASLFNFAHMYERLNDIQQADAREHAGLWSALRDAPIAPTETRVVERVVDVQTAQQVEHARKVAGELDALLIAARDRQAAIPAPPPPVVVPPQPARAIGVLSPGQKLIRARLALRQKKGKK